MARPRKYGSDAEKQAAWRKRSAGELVEQAKEIRERKGPSHFDRARPTRLAGRKGQDPAIAREVFHVPKQEGVTGEVEFEGALYEAKRRYKLTEDEYIARMLGRAEAEIRREPHRRDRVIRHARWLYAGFIVGLIPADTLL